MKTYVLLFSLFWLGVITVNAADYYVVPTNPAAANPYTDWTTAGTNIIDVVNDAMTNPGTRTVWVTNGEYFLTNQIAMTNIITVRSFSGDYSNTLVGYNGDTHTTRCFYVTSTGTVDGFTISNGHFMISNNYTGGGGAYVSKGTIQNCNFIYNICSNSGLESGGGAVFVAGGGIISNCTFFTNVCYTPPGTPNGSGSGGAIHLYGGSVFNCLVISNVVTYYGGGINTSGLGSDVVSNCFITYCRSTYGGGVLMGGGLVTDCVLSNNSSGRGGGIYPQNAAAKVQNCTIVNNYGDEGGGVDLEYGGTVSNCNIYGNRGGSPGGGGVSILSGGSLHIVDSCKISNNTCAAGLGGGGVYIRNGALVRNCLISNNTNLVSPGGGGVCLTNASLYTTTVYGLINCTIVNNYSVNEGGGIGVFGTNNYIANCIIDGNSSSLGNYPNVYNTEANSNNCWYSCATGVVFAPSQGNITNVPMFVDSANGNWRLKTRSPCVNTGTNQNWMSNSYDLDGKKRIRYGTVDMGAYERIYDGSMYSVH